MKEFNEAMIRNYREFNNGGMFEIEGYTVKFDNHSKTLETDYPYANDLRLWWFSIEQEAKTEDEKRINYILECGFEDVTEEAINELTKKETKTSKAVLDRMKRANQRLFKNGNFVIVYGKWLVPSQEKKQLSRIYNCDVKDASNYFDKIGKWSTWINL